MRLKNTKTILSIGFAIVLGLMALLMVTGLTILNANIERLDAIVNTSNIKTNLLTQMRTSARERTVSLQKMQLMKDPFEQNDEWSELLHHGAEFIVARDQLLTMPITKEEKNLLDDFFATVRQVGPAQRQVADLILNDEHEAAYELLMQRAFTLQSTAFEKLSKILEYQKAITEQAVKDTSDDYDIALTIMLIIAAVVVLVSILIAIYVIRRSSESEKQLHKEKERALVTLYSIGDGVITTDATGIIEHMNLAAEKLTGWTNEEATGKPIQTIFPVIHEGNHNKKSDPVRTVLDEKILVTSDGDTLLTRDDGKEFAIEHTVAPIFDEQKNIAGTILVFRDVTEMRALSNRLAYQARHDSLTGLHNRMEFEENLEQALIESRRYENLECWLCYLDLDQFKIINDTCGHVAGDELLRQIADTLKRHVRESDLVARMGGDEFSILLKYCKVETAKQIVEKIRAAIESIRFSWEDNSFTASASIGLVPINANSGALTTILSSADTACYVAKNMGRNRIHLYEAGDDATALHEGEMRWVNRINQALENNSFELYYQSISPLHKENPEVHCELLLRMTDENKNIILPMSFIPAAERYNLMTKIDRWVIGAAFDQFSKCPGMKSKNFTCNFTINLSSQSLCDDDFLPFILEKFSKTGVNARNICFEITETCAIANLSQATSFISTLRDKGCRFSLDDFGSGLSSFGYLKNLPVDYLKIDGIFMRNILNDKMDQALVESINQIGHVMGIKTIAEYVDDAQKIEILRRIGVDYIQGFENHRPAPLNDLLHELKLDQIPDAVKITI